MTQLAIPKPKHEDSLPSFEADVLVALRRLRTSFAELIAGLPGSRGIRKAADLQRALRIGGTPAWQVYMVASATDPLSAGPHVPGEGPMKRLLDAASSLGVSRDVLRETEGAYEAFQNVVLTHAGDRKSFDTMVRGLAGDDDDSISIEHRRAAFRANGHIWGLQTRTMLRCSICHPGAVPDTADFAELHGLIDLRWLRDRAMPLLLGCMKRFQKNKRGSSVQLEPTDPLANEKHGVALIPQFCSDRLSRIRVSESEDGFVKTELLSHGIGNSSAVTCTLGYVWRNEESRYAHDEDTEITHRTGIRTPAEVIVQDMLVYDDLFGSISPNAFVVPGLPESGSIVMSKDEKLPVQIPVVKLGRGLDLLHTSDVPRYAEMAQYAIDRMGWDGTRFDVYRCRLEYPILGTTLVTHFPLHERV